LLYKTIQNKTIKQMKYLSLASAFCLVALMSACQQSGVAIDPAQQRAKVDSIVSANVKVIQDSVNTACSQRMAQEVPAKVDSIVKAQKAAAATASPVKK
jgi:hypothetical protein